MASRRNPKRSRMGCPPQTNSKEETHGAEGTGSGDSREADGTLSLVVTDPDVLDCPICYGILTTPVYECENGHVACSSCFPKLENKCPSCRLPLGHNRSRAIEKVLESVQVIGKSTKYRCKESSFIKKQHHEKKCSRIPSSCPVPDCNFVGSSSQLPEHFSCKHENSAEQLSNDLYNDLMDALTTSVREVSQKLEHIIHILKDKYH